MRIGRSLIAACAVLGVAACEVRTASEDTDGANQAENQTGQAAPQQTDPNASNPQAIARARQLAAAQGSEAQRAQLRQQARAELQDLRFVVDIGDRKLRVYRGEEEVRSHDIAVGTDDNPTPTGEFELHRVDINPEWVPPDSEWAEDRERKAPGAPDNPMGRARLVYKMPYTIHGTDNLDSLGKAVSHGSIRVANENVVELAEMLLKAGGSWEGDGWFRQMTQNRDEEFQVELQDPVPLENQE